MRISETIFFNPIFAPVLSLAMAGFGSLCLVWLSIGADQGIAGWLRSIIIALYFLWILIASAALGIPFRRRLRHPAAAFVVLGVALISVMPLFMSYYSSATDRAQAYFLVLIASVCFSFAALIAERTEFTFMRRFTFWYCILLWPVLLFAVSGWLRRAMQEKS